MKKIKNVLLLICLALFSFTVPAEKPRYQKEDFKVWGKCEMCKTTIENAVKSIDGIKTARWNVVNGKMKVKFNPELTNLDDIHKAIALVGYDTY